MPDARDLALDVYAIGYVRRGIGRAWYAEFGVSGPDHAIQRDAFGSRRLAKLWLETLADINHYGPVSWAPAFNGLVASASSPVDA